MKTKNVYLKILPTLLGLIFIANSGIAQNKFPSTGNVGIGISSPTASLHVGGSTTDTGIRTIINGRIQSNSTYGGLWLSSAGDGFVGDTGGGVIGFWTKTKSWSLVLNKVSGNVGIGTTNPTAKLTVAGNISAREVKVTANAGADFVFEKDYALRPLSELDQFVQANKHLPEIAPAAQMVKEGVNTGEFQIQLLQKIEELTLYVIAQEKRIEALEAENQSLKE